MTTFKKILLAAALVALPAFGQVDCTKMGKNFCRDLNNSPSDTTTFQFAVTFYFPEDGGFGDSAYWAQVKQHVHDMFTTYEIKDSTGKRLPVPSHLSWAYVALFASKQTLIDMSKEEYIMDLDKWDAGPAARIRHGKVRTSPTLSAQKRSYLLNGRRVEGAGNLRLQHLP